jgi:hypothetical protein
MQTDPQGSTCPADLMDTAWLEIAFGVAIAWILAWILSWI